MSAWTASCWWSLKPDIANVNPPVRCTAGPSNTSRCRIRMWAAPIIDVSLSATDLETLQKNVRLKDIYNAGAYQMSQRKDGRAHRHPPTRLRDTRELVLGPRHLAKIPIIKCTCVAPVITPMPRCVYFLCTLLRAVVSWRWEEKKKSSAGHLNVGTRVKGWSSTVSLALSKGKYTKSSQTVRVRSDPNVLLLYIEVNVQAKGFMYGSTYHVHSYMGRQRESDRPSV